MQGTVRTGSLVAATLETAGVRLQSRFLDLVNGADGQQLVGLLFLFAIVTAVITFAVGGNYRWVRYLLVGPPLFFFFTQVRITSDGSRWEFADATFPDDMRAKMLRGVLDYDGGSTQGSDVAMFFQFWNVFMSDVTQRLIALPNLTADESHLNFITKVERYMGMWDFNFIDDRNLRAFLRITMIAECSDYYMMRRMAADPHVSEPVRQYYQSQIAIRGRVLVAVASSTRDPQQSQIFNDLIQRGILHPNETMTCDRLWHRMVNGLRPIIRDNITDELRHRLAPGQTAGGTLATFIRKIYTETSRATSMTRLTGHTVTADVLDDPAFEHGLLMAIDWIIARSLWHEIWDRNQFADSFSLETHPGNRATGMGSETLVTDQIATTSNAIQQFNRTETYQFKGDYVNAALAMPHFQGLLLMLLAAAYPFFAIAVVLPGRAGAMLLWMGLWAWAKLWDFGFAVVMMIDNILYAMFPRGPNLRGDDIMDPGLAWVRIMEIDPSYSTATYYNLIATCLYAVPLVTGVLVKRGGSELVNAIHGSWAGHSTRLAGSAASFARSLQAQSYARRFQAERFNVGVKAFWQSLLSKESSELMAEYYRRSLLQGGLESGIKGLTDRALGSLKLGKHSAAVASAINKERIAMIERMILTEAKAAAAVATYDYAMGPAGMWASQSAVAARYYSHDFAPKQYPGKELMNAYYAKSLYNADPIIQALANSGTAISINEMNKVFSSKK